MSRSALQAAAEVITALGALRFGVFSSSYAAQWRGVCDARWSQTLHFDGKEDR